MTRPGRIAPIWLGCCPVPPRCVLCAPAPPPPSVTSVQSIVDRAEDGAGAVVPFFIGGPPPNHEQVDAVGGRSFMARVRPDLLDMATARFLLGRGLKRIEFDTLTFDPVRLRQIGRAYSRERVTEMALWFRERGVEISMVLGVGLPGAHHFDALQDAADVCELTDVVRIHPVLVLAESGLRHLHLEGRYEALTPDQAVTTCDAVMRVLEAHDVGVIRVGQSPVNDQIGRAVAGPYQPALRERVESVRMLRELHRLCGPVQGGKAVRLKCALQDESRVRGPSNAHLRELRNAYGLKGLVVDAQQGQRRGLVEVEVLDEA